MTTKPPVTLASIARIAPLDDAGAVHFEFRDQIGEPHTAVLPLDTLPEILMRLAGAAAALADREIVGDAEPGGAALVLTLRPSAGADIAIPIIPEQIETLARHLPSPRPPGAAAKD